MTTILSASDMSFGEEGDVDESPRRGKRPLGTTQGSAPKCARRTVHPNPFTSPESSAKKSSGSPQERQFHHLLLRYTYLKSCESLINLSRYIGRARYVRAVWKDKVPLRKKVLKFLHDQLVIFPRDDIRDKEGRYLDIEQSHVARAIACLSTNPKNKMDYRANQYKAMERVHDANKEYKYPLVYMADAIIRGLHVPKDYTEASALQYAQNLLRDYEKVICSASGGKSVSKATGSKHSGGHPYRKDEKGKALAKSLRKIIEKGNEGSEDDSEDSMPVDGREIICGFEEEERAEKKELANQPLPTGFFDAARDPHHEPTVSSNHIFLNDDRYMIMETSPHQFSCGFYSLGVSRLQGANRLLENLENPVVRQYVGEQIYVAIMRDDSAQMPDEKDIYRPIYTTFAEKYEQEQARLDTRAIETKIKEICQKEEIVRHYITHFVAQPLKTMEFQYDDDGTKVHSVLDALAYLSGFSLKLYQRLEGGTNQMILRHSYDNPDMKEVRHVLHEGGRGGSVGHFSRLKPMLMEAVLPRGSVPDLSPGRISGGGDPVSPVDFSSEDTGEEPMESVGGIGIAAPVDSNSKEKDPEVGKDPEVKTHSKRGRPGETVSEAKRLKNDQEKVCCDAWVKYLDICKKKGEKPTIQNFVKTHDDFGTARAVSKILTKGGVRNRKAPPSNKTPQEWVALWQDYQTKCKSLNTKTNLSKFCKEHRVGMSTLRGILSEKGARINRSAEGRKRKRNEEIIRDFLSDMPIKSIIEKNSTLYGIKESTIRNILSKAGLTKPPISTENLYATIRKLAAKGMIGKEIATQVNRTTGLVSRVLNSKVDEGLRNRKAAEEKRQKRNEEVYSLHKEGEKASKIATRLNLQEGLVYSILKKMKDQ